MNYETGSFTEGRLTADATPSSRRRWVIGAVLAILLAVGVLAFARRGEQPPAGVAAAAASVHVLHPAPRAAGQGAGAPTPAWPLAASWPPCPSLRRGHGQEKRGEVARWMCDVDKTG